MVLNKQMKETNNGHMGDCIEHAGLPSIRLSTQVMMHLFLL